MGLSVIDYGITFFLCSIGLGEAFHLYLLLFHKSISACGPMFLVAEVVLVIFFCTMYLLKYQHKRRPVLPTQVRGTGEKVLWFVFASLLISQLLWILFSQTSAVAGDMTAEFVADFVKEDGVFVSNPMTGDSYQLGVPMRIRILGLPTIYALFCSTFSISPAVWVFTIQPLITLLASYGAYFSLAESLFKKKSEMSAAFMCGVGLLIWCTCYGTGADGFMVLFAGARGLTIRNLILLPYTLTCMMRRNYLQAVLCICAEACIIWTLYGMGMCLLEALIYLGVVLALRLRRKEVQR